MCIIICHYFYSTFVIRVSGIFDKINYFSVKQLSRSIDSFRRAICQSCNFELYQMRLLFFK